MESAVARMAVFVSVTKNSQLKPATSLGTQKKVEQSKPVVTIDLDCKDIQAFLSGYPCDWPQGWKEDLAENKFFYLSGVRSTIAELGVAGTTNQRIALKAEAALCCPLYPPEWLSTFRPTIDRNNSAQIGAFGVGEIKGAIINDLIDHKPMTFSKAALCLCLIQNFVRRHRGDAHGLEYTLQIRLANCYIPTLSDAVKVLKRGELKNLAPLMGGTQSALSDLIDGFPVTKTYAEHLIKMLRETTSLIGNQEVCAALKIFQYASWTEVRESVRDDGRKAHSTIRAALHEADIFRLSQSR